MSSWRGYSATNSQGRSSTGKLFEGGCAIHFFLQGDPGVGKSHLLRRLMHPYASMIAGFTVQRLHQNNELVGYCAKPLAGTFHDLDAVYHPDLDGLFLSENNHDVGVLEQILDQVFQDSLSPFCRLILLDEIGGMELLSPHFMKGLMRILEGEKPCVGILKSRRNLEEMVRCQQLDRSCLMLHQRLEKFLQSNGMLVELTLDNRHWVEKQFRTYLKNLPFLQVTTKEWNG
jgi:nucleoside-triphosphatase